MPALGAKAPARPSIYIYFVELRLHLAQKHKFSVNMISRLAGLTQMIVTRSKHMKGFITLITMLFMSPQQLPYLAAGPRKTAIP